MLSGIYLIVTFVLSQWFYHLWHWSWTINLISSGAAHSSSRAHVWMYTGGLWRCDPGVLIWPLILSSLFLYSVSWPRWAKHICSPMLFHHDVFAMEPANHGVNPQKLWDNFLLNCCYCVSCGATGKLANILWSSNRHKVQDNNQNPCVRNGSSSLYYYHKHNAFESAQPHRRY